MVKYIIPAALVVVLGLAGYLLFGSKSAYAPTAGSPASSTTEPLAKTGNPNIDKVVEALEEEIMTESQVAGEADTDASVVESDSQDLNNLDKSYDSQF